jgi:hypothetical protein
MLVTPGSNLAASLIRLDQNGGSHKIMPRVHYAEINSFEWDVRSVKDRQSRRDIFDMRKRGYDTDPLVRAKLVTTECRADKEYTTMDAIFRLTNNGREAVKAIRSGLVFDTKLQQVTFSATTDFYLESLRDNSVPDWIMTMAQMLPHRYKEIHKAILLRKLFSEQDKKGNWIKVDLS